MLTLMKQILVIVKDVEGKPLLRTVVSSTKSTVLVASDDALERIKSGDPNILPVGQHAGAP